MDTLSEDLPQQTVRKLLDDVLSNLAQQHLGRIEGRNLKQRLMKLMSKIEQYVPGVESDDKSQAIVIRSCSCPVASVTASHSELCQTVANTLGRLLHTPVRENCERGEWSQCCFTIQRAPN